MKWQAYGTYLLLISLLLISSIADKTSQNTFPSHHKHAYSRRPLILPHSFLSPSSVLPLASSSSGLHCTSLCRLYGPNPYTYASPNPVFQPHCLVAVLSRYGRIAAVLLLSLSI